MTNNAIPLEELIRLTPTGIKIYIRIMNMWEIDNQDRWDLLGGTPPFNLERYEGWNPKTDIALTEDQILRISALMKVANALRALTSEEREGRWIKAPNSSTLTKGKSALQYMIDGGLPAIVRVHRYLMAQMQCHYL
jgi:hypothetical protein